jgi:biotin transporter BioY
MEQVVVGSRSSVVGFRIAALVGGAVLVAAAAQISVPLPGTPVPMTLQPMAVLLVGGLLGARFGALSMILYLAMGAVGLPVFTPTVPLFGIARLLGPTGGYLLAYPVAAWVVGTFVGTVGDGRALRGRARLESAPLQGAPEAEPGLSARVRTPRYWSQVTLGALTGLVLIHLGGLAQLAIITGSIAGAAQLATVPFLLGDLLKIAVLVPVLTQLTPTIRARL